MSIAFSIYSEVYKKYQRSYFTLKLNYLNYGKFPFYEYLDDNLPGLILKPDTTGDKTWIMLFEFHHLQDTDTTMLHKFVGKNRDCVDFGLGTNNGKWYREEVLHL